jgi:hypothetical protein
MVPKLHRKGRSFRGAAMYLLHDKGRSKSQDRVAWTQTRNLAVDDPHLAWRIMAHTALAKDHLKQRAGVKNSGRKSDDVVLHLTLSWHPDEKQGLSRDEMMRAALGAIRALRADDRQALFVSHDDEPQPHLHVLLNRVSPEDGRMLSSSKEKLALSRWAQAYEKERGAILCEERVINNAARDRGEYTRGDADKPRHIFELEAANENRPDADVVRKQERGKDARVAEGSRELKKRHTVARGELGRQHRQRAATIRSGARKAISEQTAAVRDRFRPEWRNLFREQRADEREFSQREQQVLGRVENAIRLIDFGAIVKSGQRRRAISEVFRVLASSGSRMQVLRRRHQAEYARLAARQRAEEKAAAAAVRARRSERLSENRALYQRERNDLRLKQRLELAAVRSQWKTRSAERKRAWYRGHEKESGTGRLAELRKSAESRRSRRAKDRDRDEGHDRGR